MGDLGRLGLDGIFLAWVEQDKFFAVGLWKDLLPGFAAKRTTFLVLNTPIQLGNKNAHNENGGICAKYRRIV